MMTKYNILITGVAGFLGSHLSEKLLDLGHKVIGVDSMIGGYEKATLQLGEETIREYLNA